MEKGYIVNLPGAWGLCLGCLCVHVYMGGHWLVSCVRMRACVRAWGMGVGGLVCLGVLRACEWGGLVCLGVRGGVGELFNTINWVCLWVWLYPGVKPYI